jgi:hypothetical protein
MAAPVTEKGPTGEIGTANAFGSFGLPGTPGWTMFLPHGEHVPELAWPLSNHVFEQMLTNPQVWGLFMGFDGEARR